MGELVARPGFFDRGEKEEEKISNPRFWRVVSDYGVSTYISGLVVPGVALSRKGWNENNLVDDHGIGVGVVNSILSVWSRVLCWNSEDGPAHGGVHVCNSIGYRVLNGSWVLGVLRDDERQRSDGDQPHICKTQALIQG